MKKQNIVILERTHFNNKCMSIFLTAIPSATCTEYQVVLEDVRGSLYRFTTFYINDAIHEYDVLRRKLDEEQEVHIDVRRATFDILGNSYVMKCTVVISDVCKIDWFVTCDTLGGHEVMYYEPDNKEDALSLFDIKAKELDQMAKLWDNL